MQPPAPSRRNRAEILLSEMSPRTFAMVAFAAVAMPLAAVPCTSGVADAVAVGAAVLGGLGVLAVWSVRRRVAGLPLEIAGVGLEGRRDGHAVYRFRVRLGRGRSMRDARATVRFVSSGGEAVDLPCAAEPGPLILGPWTILAEDPGGRCDGPGAFLVRVRVREARRNWECEARFPREALVEGRFGPGMRVERGRLVWDASTWDTVVSETAEPFVPDLAAPGAPDSTRGKACR